MLRPSLDILLLPDGAIWLQIYGCTIWNISGILESTESFRSCAAPQFSLHKVYKIGLSHTTHIHILQTNMIQPLGYYNQYLDLEVCTWMKKSEGNACFFHFGSTQFPCWNYTP